MNLVEHIGSGVKRIREALRHEGLPDPVIEADAHWFSIAFRRKGPEIATAQGGEKGGEKGVVDTKRRVLDALAHNPKATISQLAQHLSIGEKRIEKHLADLKAMGRLRRVGPDRGGHWEVVEGEEG